MKINGKSCQALLDNGAQINTITPTYVRSHSLEMGPITDLIGARVTCVGLGNAYNHPLGYVIVWVQVDIVQGYDKDQIALVILDESKFVEWVPVILGTPYYRPCCECHEGEGNRCLGDAMGKHQGSTSIIHALSCCHSVSGPNLRKCQSKWV